MNKNFIEGAGIKQLATIKFTHSLLDIRRWRLNEWSSPVLT